MFNFSISNNLNNIEKQQLFKSQEDLKKEFNDLKEDLNLVNENNKKLLDLQDKSLKAFESCSTLIKENKDNLEQSVDMLTDLIKEDRKSINNNSRKIKSFQQQIEDLKQSYERFNSIFINYKESLENANKCIRELQQWIIGFQPQNNEILKKMTETDKLMIMELKRINTLIPIQQLKSQLTIHYFYVNFSDIYSSDNQDSEKICFYCPFKYSETLYNLNKYYTIQISIFKYLKFIYDKFKFSDYIDTIFDFIKNKMIICNKLINNINVNQLYELCEVLDISPYDYFDNIEQLDDFNKILNLKSLDIKHYDYFREAPFCIHQPIPKQLFPIFQHFYNPCLKSIIIKLNKKSQNLMLYNDVKLIELR